MNYGSSELGVTRVGLPLLRDLIAERTGLHYGDDREDALAERLASIVLDCGFRSYLDLFYLLKYEDGPSDWGRVMDELSVPETYFWREIDQVKAVVECIVPELAARSGNGPLRIWSIPCASGEEPLTIAILLQEGGWFDRVPIEIYGSDASPAAIRRAINGVYRDRAFRALPFDLKERYFTPADGGWRPVPSLSARVVSWSLANLVEVDRAALASVSSVVFCRNAFIYFSPAAIRKSIQQFADSMPTPGYLCVGASESLLGVTNAFTLQEVNGAFLYVKR